MDWEKDWQGEHVYLSLKNGRKFTGRIIEVNRESDGTTWIKISDKYSRPVVINTATIEFIQVENEK